MGLPLGGVLWVLHSITQAIDTFYEVHMDVLRIRLTEGQTMKYSHGCSTSWQWQTLNSLCRGPWVWTIALKYVITFCNITLAMSERWPVQASNNINGIPSVHFAFNWMFGYVKGCLISLCLHRVSLRVATLCTAGACLASNVKPGSLWNLTKVSSGRGWKLTLIWRLQSFLLGHTGAGQGHQKPPFFLHPSSCRMNS